MKLTGFPGSVKAEVTSSNTVGYTKISIPAGKQTIIGVQFQQINGGTVDLQNIKTEGYSQNGGDWVMIWDAPTQSYTKAFYWGENSADGGVWTGGADDPDAVCLGAGWGDTDAVVIDATLSAGQGLWTKSVQQGQILVSGEVATSLEVSIPAGKQTLVCNPLPVEVDLQDIAATGYSQNGGDWVMVWDATTQSYTKAFYWGENSADGGVWTGGADDPDAVCLGAGWGDTDAVVVNATIAVGQGFWTKSVATGTLVFPALPAASAGQD